MITGVEDLPHLGLVDLGKEVDRCETLIAQHQIEASLLRGRIKAVRGLLAKQEQSAAKQPAARRPRATSQQQQP